MKVYVLTSTDQFGITSVRGVYKTDTIPKLTMEGYENDDPNDRDEEYYELVQVEVQK